MEREIKIARVWFDEGKIFIETQARETFWQSLLYYRRLREATDEQRNSYRISYSGIHWADIDEDISFNSFLRGNKEPDGISRLFLTHPELNAAAVARRLGMKQSLLAAYICGSKKPSKERETEIAHAVQKIGEELITEKL